MGISTTYDPGKMDKRVLLQVYTETVGTNGERTSTWSDYDWRWAAELSSNANETKEGDLLIIGTTTTFRLRFDAKVTEKYRLLFRNRIYNILGINEVDRKRFMDLSCEAGDIFKPLTADDTYLTADAETVTADATMY